MQLPVFVLSRKEQKPVVLWVTPWVVLFWKRNKKILVRNTSIFFFLLHGRFFFFLINILILFLKDAVFSFCLWKLHSWWQIQLIFSLSFHLTQKNLISNLNPVSYISDFAYLILQSVPLYFILALRVHCFLLLGDKYLLCDASLWDTPSS